MKATHCPENCCSQTFDWKLFSRCHQLVHDEIHCQNLFVCEDCRASDKSSLLTALHRKCQHRVTLFITRTSSSNHQVTFLTHQPPKEFKVPVCGRTLRRNDAAEFMFGAFFFLIHDWNESVLCSLITQPEFFLLCRHNILDDGEIWGRLWFKKTQRPNILFWFDWCFALFHWWKNVVCCARSQTVWSSVIWLHVTIAKWNKFEGFLRD